VNSSQNAEKIGLKSRVLKKLAQYWVRLHEWNENFWKIYETGVHGKGGKACLFVLGRNNEWIATGTNLFKPFLLPTYT